MNKQTAVFLCELGNVSGNSSFLHLLWREMKQMHWDLFSPFTQDSEVVWYSDDAKKLKNRIEHSVKEITEISNSSQALAWMDRSLQQKSEIDAQIETTLSALQKTGSIRLTDLHILLPETKVNFAARVEEYVRVQLYRYLMFAEDVPEIRPPTHRDIVSLLDFYQNDIGPRLEALLPKQCRQQWAVELDSDLELGGLFRLPSFKLTVLDSRRRDILPGKHVVCQKAKNWRYQGRGRLTNITPNCVFEALEAGYHTALQTSMLDRFCDELGSPERCLEKCFQGAYYVVSPYLFFSMASTLMGKHAIEQRLLSRSCVCCGSPLLDTDQCVGEDGKVMCSVCLGKMEKLCH